MSTSRVQSDLGRIDQRSAFFDDGTPPTHTTSTRMNLTLTPIYFPVTLPIVAPVGDTAACTAVAETSLRESERRLRAFVSCTHRKKAGHPRAVRRLTKEPLPSPPKRSARRLGPDVTTRCSARILNTSDSGRIAGRRSPSRATTATTARSIARRRISPLIPRATTAKRRTATPPRTMGARDVNVYKTKTWKRRRRAGGRSETRRISARAFP